MEEIFMEPVQLSKGINIKELIGGQSEFHIDLDFQKKSMGMMGACDDDLFPDMDDDSDSDDVFKTIELAAEKMLLSCPEYHSFKDLASKMVDCVPTGEVKMLIMEEGDGPLVPVDAMVTIHYAAYYEKAKIPFDSTLTRSMNNQAPLRKMYRLIILAASFQFTICQQYQQKVAPGVPPQTYQQQQQYQQPPPPPQQQYQPPPQQQQQQYQQQPPQQFQQQQPQQFQQQPPQQQYQQQVPVQQIPVQQTPQGHGHHGSDPHILDAANIAHEREHIQEHMEVPIDTSKMSEQELQFHYFKMHDADNNNKLDGCELIKSLIHWHEQGHKQQPQPGTPPAEEKIFKDDELINLIDPILNMDDHNRDGYIDYPEFIRAQQKNQNKDG